MECFFIDYTPFLLSPLHPLGANLVFDAYSTLRWLIPDVGSL